MIRHQTIFLSVMSLVYALAAIWTVEPPVRIFAASFSVASLAAGPGTSVRRRMGLRVAALAVLAGLLLWFIQQGRV